MALWEKLLRNPRVKLPAFYASALVRTIRFSAVYLNPTETALLGQLPPVLDLEFMGVNTLPVITNDVPRVVMSSPMTALDTKQRETNWESLETADALVALDFVEALESIYHLVTKTLKSQKPHMLSKSLMRIVPCLPRSLLMKTAPKHPWTVGVLLAFTPFIGAIDTQAEWLSSMDAAVLESRQPPLPLSREAVLLDDHHASLLVAFATVVILSNKHFRDRATLHHMTCVYLTVRHMIQRGCRHSKRVSFPAHELPEGHTRSNICSVMHGKHFTQLMTHTTEMARVLRSVVAAAAAPAGPGRDALMGHVDSGVLLLATGFRCVAEDRLDLGSSCDMLSPSLVTVNQLAPSEFDQQCLHAAGPSELHTVLKFAKNLEADAPVVYLSVVGTTMSGVATLLKDLSDVCGQPQVGGVDHPCQDTGESACLVVMQMYVFRVWMFYMHLRSATDTSTHNETAGDKVFRPAAWKLANMLWQDKDNTSTCAMMLVRIASHWIHDGSGTYESIDALHIYRRFRAVIDRTARLQPGFFPSLSYIFDLDLDAAKFCRQDVADVQPAPCPGTVAAGMEAIFKELGYMESIVRGLSAENVALCQSADASTLVLDGQVICGNVFVAAVHRIYNACMDPHLAMLIQEHPVSANEIRAAIRDVSSSRAGLPHAKRRRTVSPTHYRV